MTTQQPIRIGLIGANIHQGWSPRAHLPALAAHSQFDLSAVCTTRQESADEAMAAFDAGSAWDDYNRMLADADVEAATISLRVPSHYEPTTASLQAGKHTFTEWPLGRTTAEAVEMAEVARQQGVRTAVGLQARANPAIVHLRNLVADGYVGRVMTCHVRLMREGVLSRVSGRTWQRDNELGANTLTIACGHTIDALCSVVGEFADVAAVVSTQAATWHETDTGLDLPVTSPDNVLVSGNLRSGGVASVQIGSTAWAGSGYRMEIYGEEGTLVAVSVDSPQLQQVSVRGARGGSNDLQELTPESELHPAPEIPGGAAYNVGQLYSQFAASIRGDESADFSVPDFDHAVGLHRLIDAIRQSSDEGRRVSVA
jgi:predicted dehydrogenase